MRISTEHLDHGKNDDANGQESNDVFSCIFQVALQRANACKATCRRSLNAKCRGQHHPIMQKALRSHRNMPLKSLIAACLRLRYYLRMN